MDDLQDRVQAIAFEHEAAQDRKNAHQEAALDRAANLKSGAGSGKNAKRAQGKGKSNKKGTAADKRNPNVPRMKVQSKRDDKILSKRDYLADYFATLEGFQYKPSLGSLEQLSEARQLLEWDGKQYHEAHKQLEDALVQQFNHNFGSSSNDVAGWMAVCKAAGSRAVPSDIGGCRRVLQSMNVNMIDIIDACHTKSAPQVFTTAEECSQYARETHKIIPGHNTYASLLFVSVKYCLNPANRERRREENVSAGHG